MSECANVQCNGICATVLCNCCCAAMAGDVLSAVLVAIKTFMAQLLSPRQIALSRTIQFAVLFILYKPASEI